MKRLMTNGWLYCFNIWSCRRADLLRLTLDDIEDFPVVFLRDGNIHIPRSFTTSEGCPFELCGLYRKDVYFKTRKTKGSVDHRNDKSFGKHVESCTISSVPKEITKYLNQKNIVDIA